MEINHLVHIIDQLNDKEHYMEIAKIILKQKDINYTGNSNGMFLDAQQLTPSTIKRIKSYLKRNKLLPKTGTDLPCTDNNQPDPSEWIESL